jgi:thioredoxin reductase (NADPH)
VPERDGRGDGRHHEELAEKHPSVGRVRSIGLFGIVELVRNRETMEPMAPFNGTSDEMARSAALPGGRPLHVRALEHLLHQPAADHHRGGAGRRVRDHRHEPVTAVLPVGEGEDRHFEVESRSARGHVRVRQARAVVLAMGYYGRPNRLGVPGEDLPHVAHYYGEAHPYYRQRVVVVGGKNSACEAALELYRAGAHVTLVHRGATLGDSVKYWVRPDIENRIKDGAIAAWFSTEIVAIRPTEVEVRQAGADRTETIPAEAVLLLTGYQADHGFLRTAGVELDPETLIPRHDPATFETNVPNLFIAGGQLAGVRTGSVFIENGRFHGEQVAQVLATRLRGGAGEGR